LKSLYYDVALSTSPCAFFALKELAGASHILFGTDYPLRCENGVTESIRLFDDYPYFDEEEKRIIAYQTSQKLFPRFSKIK